MSDAKNGIRDGIPKFLLPTTHLASSRPLQRAAQSIIARTDGLRTMNHDQTFRAVLIVVFLVVIPIGIYHRLKSQATREKLDRRQEGLFILATLRPVGIAFWLELIAWMVNPGWMAWSSVSLPGLLRWTGVGLIAIACGLLVWTFLCLGKNLTDTVVTRQAHTLVTTWPLSLGPASVLRFRRVACAGGFFDHGELALLCDRRCAVLFC